MVACHCSSRSHGRFTACAGISANYYLSVRLHPARCADDLLLVNWCALCSLSSRKRWNVDWVASQRTNCIFCIGNGDVFMWLVKAVLNSMSVIARCQITRVLLSCELYCLYQLTTFGYLPLGRTVEGAMLWVSPNWKGKMLWVKRKETRGEKKPKQNCASIFYNVLTPAKRTGPA